MRILTVVDVGVAWSQPGNAVTCSGVDRGFHSYPSALPTNLAACPATDGGQR